MRIQPWTEKQLMAREDVFEALVGKALRGTMRRVASDVREGALTAAVSQPAAPPPPAPTVSYTALESAVLATWSGFVDRELFPFLTDTFMESSEKVVGGLTAAGRAVSDTLTNTYADEFLQYAYNRMVGVGEDLWRNIRAELEAGHAAGEGIKEIAARLTQVAGLTAPRANTVARTELISAANAGSYLQVVAAGFDNSDTTKIWLATEDSRTRLSHRHADDQDVPLLDEFSVDIYSGDVKTGTEEMEFPGDPVATPGNVINCRCSLAFEFSDDEGDDVLTADGFVEAEHPRKHDGKFKKKGAPDGFLKIPSLDDKPSNSAPTAEKVVWMAEHKWEHMSPGQKGVLIKSITAEDWKQIPPELKSKIKDAPETTSHPEAQKLLEKAVLELDDFDTATSRPQGGKDTKTGKTLSPGKPVKLKVQFLYNTSFEDGAVMAVRKDNDERLVWDGKNEKILRQKRDVDGKFETTETRTRGDAYQAWKDEDGWTIPEAATVEETPAVTAPTGGKPIFLRVQTIYNTKYDDGDMVAVNPGTGEKIHWDATKKKMVVTAADGSTKEYTRGALYKDYKDSPGWFTPGGDTSPNEPDDIVDTDVPAVAEKPKIAVKQMQEVAPEPESAPSFAESMKLKRTKALIGEELYYAEGVWVNKSEKGVSVQKGIHVAYVPTGQLNDENLKAAFKKVGAEYPDAVTPAAPAAPKKLPKYEISEMLNDAAFTDNGEDVFENDDIQVSASKSYILVQSKKNGASAQLVKSGLTVSELSKAIDTVMGGDSIKETKKADLGVDVPENVAPGPSQSVFPGQLTKGQIGGILDNYGDLSDLGKGGSLFNDGNVAIIKGPGTDVIVSNLKTGETAILNGEDLNGPALDSAVAQILDVPAPANLPEPGGVPLKLGYSVLVNPKTTKYNHGQIIATNPDNGERLIWNGATKKYVVQKQDSSGAWSDWHTYTKQGAYKNLKDDAGWMTPVGQTYTNDVAPTVNGNPVPSVITPAPVSASELAETSKTKIEANQKTADSLIAQLTESEQDKLFNSFKNTGGSIYLTTGEAEMFSKLLKVQKEHNKSSNIKLDTLATLRLIDNSSAKKLGVANANLYEKKIVSWLKTPTGKMKSLEILNDFNMTPAEKAAKLLAQQAKKAAEAEAQAAEAAKQLKEFVKIPVSVPLENPTSDVYPEMTISKMKTLHNKTLAEKPWSAASESALKSYTGAYYQTLNNGLRGKSTLSPSDVKAVTNAQKGMRPLPQNILLFRGIDAIPALPADLGALQAMVGKTFKEPGFSSTTINPQKAFPKQIRLIIEAPEGASGVWLEGITNVHGEEEVLLAAGTKFKVLGAEKVGYKYNVRVRIVP